MALRGRRVTVTTAATRLDSQDSDATSGQAIAVTNAGATAVDIGDATVATGSGYELAAGATVSLELASDEALYAVAASGTVVIHVLETGV